MRLDLRNKLSVENWEKALHEFPITVRKGWSQQVRTDGLLINLSKVGWVEPVAALRLVLFIEAALLEGIEVTVNLPYPFATSAEQRNFDLASHSKDKALQRKAQYIGNNVKRRVAASTALRDFRFKEALLHPHIKQAPGQLTIIDYHDWSLPGSESNTGATPPALASILSDETSLPWTFDVVYGLQWIPDPRSAEGRKIIDHLAEIDILSNILTHPSQRVSTADGATLAHVFLKELVENATDHSERPFALIAAMRRQHGYNLKEDEIYECEKGFASWCKSYPLIEVMVGDSGSGIPRSLLKEYQIRRPPPPEKLKESSLNTRILAWAFDKWSSKSSATSKRGTRGLYRAERIVRKYDGCITLRSESSYVGVECGFNNPPDYIYQQGLPKIPGTIVHVRLPVIPSEKLPPRTANPALHRAHMEVVDFFDLNWDNVERAIEFVCEEIRRKSRGKSSNRRPSCFVLDFGYVNLERRTLEDLLLRLVLIAHPVALVVTSVKAPSADSAQQTIHSIAEQLAPQEGSGQASAEFPEGTDVRDAILFQNTDGTFAWVGAAPNITTYLNQLWRQEKITAEDLASELPDAAERNELIRQFAEAYHVVHRSDRSGILALNFNRQDITDALQRHIEALLVSKISKGSSTAVRVGNFRTPSLEIVSRYVKVKTLLSEVGLERATAVLARKCASVSSLQVSKSFQIIADSTASREVLESFRSSLSSILQLPPSSSVISQVNQGEVPDVVVDNAILFTDVILAGDLLGGLISQILRARKTPALIVTGFDARSEEMRGKPMSVMGRHIDVISIVDIDIWVKNPGRAPEPINISPITHEPEVAGGEPGSDYPISHDRLTQMIEEQNALYFDHIVRPNGRHLCFYLDPFRLLGALNTDDPYDLSENGRSLIREFEHAIDQWLSPEQTLDVIYFPNLPRSERPSATKQLIGKKLAERYGADLRGVSSLSEISLPEPNLPTGSRVFQYQSRRTSNDQQQILFDTSQSDSVLFDLESSDEIVAKHQTVAIIDWGSVTGTGIRASIRYAAAKGASKIIAVALLSQLPFDEERFLASLTGVETVVNTEGAVEVRRCEVKVIFLARYPTQVYEPRLCPYCRQLGRLAEEERFLPTKLLADFIEEAKSLLRTRRIDGEDGVRWEHEQRRLHSTKATNLPGFSDTYQLTTMAALRNQIDMARRWTSERLRIHQELSKLEVSLNKEAYRLRMNRRCLVKLLAVEWLWLKREPLSMGKFKRQISRLAINVIKDRYCSQREKLEAIIVLRTASKDSFAQFVPEIFDTLVRDRKATEEGTLTLVSLLLYCSFTYLQRDYLMAPALEPLVDALGTIASRVHELLGGPKQAIALRVGRTVNSLHQYGRFLLHSLTPLTASAAWRELQSQLGEKHYHTHHPAYGAFDALRFGPLEDDIEDSAKPLPRINWAAKRNGWITWCEPFITETLLPLLAPLREVFEGLDATLMVGPDAETLAIGTREIFENLSILSTALTVFSKNPNAVRQLDRWKRFVNARNIIWKLLIDPGDRRGSAREGGSALIRLLKNCPTDIVGLMEEVISENSFNSKLRVRLVKSLSPNNRFVFCHVDILRDGVLELLRNASRHVRGESETEEQAPVNTIPDHKSIPVEMVLSEEGEQLCLAMKNGGILVDSQVHGRGLKMFRERLSPYGASLERINDLRAPWVFGVKISMMKG
jgi:hypothetical protein